MGFVESFKRFLVRVSRSRYFSTATVCVGDLIVSVLSTFAALMMVKYLFGGSTIISRAEFYWTILCSFLFSLIFFRVFRTHRVIIRHTTLHSVVRISLAAICKDISMLLVAILLPYITFSDKLLGMLLIDLILTFAALVTIRVAMVVVYTYLKESLDKVKHRKNFLIFGIDTKSVALLTRFESSDDKKIVGFLEFGNKKRKLSVDNAPVYTFESQEDIALLKEKHAVDAILFAREENVRKEHDRLIRYCLREHLNVYIAPSIDEVVDGNINRAIREIKIEDLLGREEIEISMDEIEENLGGKVVLVTGAAGSIGSELCRQLARFGVKHLVLFDNAETPMHNIRLELEDKFKELSFTPVVGDVRHSERLKYLFERFHPQVVFHAAAYKHVPLMEENPCEAVMVNLYGSKLVADKCLEYGVEKMVMISTDKAVNPTNIMGCTKRLAEIYVQSLGLSVARGENEGKTQFVTTRFGNVLGSNGSVIPRFRTQIEHGGPVTVTHPDITRFFMSIPEACRLVLEAAAMPLNNEILVFDMGKSVKIDTLARRMIRLAGFEPDKDIKVEYSGLRPGEKLYEEVLADEETTKPTSHERIKIADVRESSYQEVLALTERLKELAIKVEIDEMVSLMKDVVPEYKSENSQFERLDKKSDNIK